MPRYIPIAIGFVVSFLSGLFVVTGPARSGRTDTQVREAMLEVAVTWMRATAGAAA